jgi:3-oxoacyl-[acyl-carrier protein] reductase
VAGAFRFSNVWEMTEETWDMVTAVKPKGYFNTIRHAAPFMMKQRWGRILNCTSKAWAGDSLKHCEYAAANAGVVGLTRAVASELWQYGITCNAFSPWARTRASWELEAYSAAVHDAQKPSLTKGPGLPYTITPSPDDLGPAVVWLASDYSAKVSGSVFNFGGPNVGIYEEPEVKRAVTKFGGRWTVEELKSQIPRVLLAGYQPHVANP